MNDLKSLYLCEYLVVIRAVEELNIPQHAGSALRGVFGRALRKLACETGLPDCKSCELKARCLYCYIFETLPAAGQSYGRFSSPPNPYLFYPVNTKEHTILPGEVYSFVISLIGRANKYLPHIVTALIEMGNIGLFKGRGRYELTEIHSLGLDGKKTEIYSVSDKTIRPAGKAISIEAFADMKKEQDGVALVFETPARIKADGDLAVGLPFRLIMERLYERAILLDYFHCGGSGEKDENYFGNIDTVEILENRLTWFDPERISFRSKQKIRIGGHLGRISYSGPVGKCLPLLKFGEHLHIGKGTTIGLGKYRVETDIS